VSAEWIATGEGEMSQPIQPLDRELLIEAATIIRMAEDTAGVKVRAEKLGELILAIYNKYAAGAEVSPVEVIQLVRKAA